MRRVGTYERLESSPCSLWQSEQDALSKSQSVTRRLLLSSRPQRDGSMMGRREQRRAGDRRGSFRGPLRLVTHE